MTSLPTKCGFCGKQKNEAKKLMIGLAVNWEGEQFQNCICDECLGIQMTVLADLDRDLFEGLVETARGNQTEPKN
jgi:hypothetical protein